VRRERRDEVLCAVLFERCRCGQPAMARRLGAAMLLCGASMLGANAHDSVNSGCSMRDCDGDRGQAVEGMEGRAGSCRLRRRAGGRRIAGGVRAINNQYSPLTSAPPSQPEPARSGLGSARHRPVILLARVRTSLLGVWRHRLGKTRRGPELMKSRRSPRCNRILGTSTDLFGWYWHPDGVHLGAAACR
jgi:hypothetical protein